MGALWALLALDIASFYTRGTGVIVGFYWGCFMTAWFALVLAPIALRTQRIRREKGWPLEYVEKKPRKDFGDTTDSPDASDGA